MKERLAVALIVGLLLVGGVFLFRSWKGLPRSPVQTAVPGRVDGQDTPASSIPVRSSNEPVIAPPGTTAPAVSSTTAASTTVPERMPTEGLIGDTPTPAGRAAPDTAAGPLQFDQIRIYANPAGLYAGIANARNSGEAFLNQLEIGWQIAGKDGRVMDKGQVTWPSLAPGETATISFEGTKPYSDAWEKIIFDFQP